MGKAIPYDHRAKIVRERQSGRDRSDIARDLGCSVRAVDKIWAAFRKSGESALRTKYHNCGRRKNFPDVRRLIDAHRREGLGAPYLVSVLSEKHPGKKFPHERTVQYWWKDEGSNRPKGRPPKPREPFVHEVHHTWQIDGKEQMVLSGGGTATWLNIADEASGADLLCRVFPPEQSGGDQPGKGPCRTVRVFRPMGPARTDKG